MEINEFLEQLHRRGSLTRVSQNTLRAYRNTLILFGRFLNGREPSQELAQEFIMSLMDKHRKATITRHGYALRRYLDWLGIDSKLLLPTPERQLPDYLTEEELERLLKKARTPLERAIISVLVDTGLRIDELLRLTLEDIDWKEGFVFAHREKTGMHGWIPIGEKALSALQEYIAWKKIKGGKARIFPYKYRDIWRWLRELGELSGLGERLHPHILRHTAAALRRLQGQSLEDLKELLGHKNIQTTTIYSALKSRELKERIKGVL